MREKNIEEKTVNEMFVELEAQIAHDYHELYEKEALQDLKNLVDYWINQLAIYKN